MVYTITLDDVNYIIKNYHEDEVTIELELYWGDSEEGAQEWFNKNPSHENLSDFNNEKNLNIKDFITTGELNEHLLSKWKNDYEQKKNDMIQSLRDVAFKGGIHQLDAKGDTTTEMKNLMGVVYRELRAKKASDERSMANRREAIRQYWAEYRSLKSEGKTKEEARAALRKSKLKGQSQMSEEDIREIRRILARGE